MKRQTSISAKSIRFRQWSRKGYAVFSGLHKVISIGKISAGICEKALLKNNLLSSVCPILSENNFITDREKEPEKELLSFEQFYNINSLPTAIDYPAGCSSQYLLTRGWKREKGSFPTFFIFKK